jgi:hypothetical protein
VGPRARLDGCGERKVSCTYRGSNPKSFSRNELPMKIDCTARAGPVTLLGMSYRVQSPSGLVQCNYVM